MIRIVWPTAPSSQTAAGPDGKPTITWRRCPIHNIEFPVPTTCYSCDATLLHEVQSGNVRIVGLEENEEWPDMNIGTIHMGKIMEEPVRYTKEELHEMYPPLDLKRMGYALGAVVVLFGIISLVI